VTDSTALQREREMLEAHGIREWEGEVNDVAWWARVVQARTERRPPERTGGSRRESSQRAPAVTIAVQRHPAAGPSRRSSRKTSTTCCGSTRRTASRGKRQGRYLLSAVLKIGWRIVRASPEEQAMLEAHGFGSRRIQ
jgi:hypothetical protein